jgi:hypothetical protein
MFMVRPHRADTNRILTWILRNKLLKISRFKDNSKEVKGKVRDKARDSSKTRTSFLISSMIL